MNEQDPSVLSVTVVLTGKRAELFLESVNKSGRSNRSEAKLRIEDHIAEYAEISSVGTRVKRK